jgi:hypothetical protein
MSGGPGIDDATGATQPQSTEDDILDTVEDVTGDKFDVEDEDEDETDADDDDGEEDTPPAPQRARQDGPREPVSRREVQSRIPTQRRVDYDYDRQGNVINPRDGTIIYPMGTPQRELFSQLQNERYNRSRVEGAVREMAQRGQSLEQAVQDMQRAATVGDTLKLSTRDQVLAMEHMAHFRADPVKGLRRMLNLYIQEGGDLTNIFDNLEKIQLEGLEQRLTSQFDKITKPEREAEAERKRVGELTQRINQDVQTFFSANPEAEQHADLLAHIIDSAAQQGRSVSLMEAYINVLKFAQARGLDLSRPLDAQLTSQPRRGALPRSTSTPRVQPNNSGKPLHDRSTRDLVREAMEEAGFDT